MYSMLKGTDLFGDWIKLANEGDKGLWNSIRRVSTESNHVLL
jgi:hypothetical protein